MRTISRSRTWLVVGMRRACRATSTRSACPASADVTAEALADYFGSIDALHEADPEKIVEVDGVGPIMAEQIAESLGDDATWALVEKLREKGLRLEADKSERRVKGGPLEGKTVVLTGTLPELIPTRSSR